MNLTPEERETIITFDETNAEGTVFTYNKVWQRHLEKKLGLVVAWNNGLGGKGYYIPKKRIRMPQPTRKLSPEHKAKLVKRLTETRQQKSIISSKSPTAIKESKDKTSSVGKRTDRQKKGAK